MKKKHLLIIVPFLLFIGCSKSVENKILINRDGLVYLPDSNKPYSGSYHEKNLNEDILREGIYKNGKLIKNIILNNSGFNLISTFYDNGNKHKDYYLINREIWKLRNYEGPLYDSSFTSWYENENIREKGNYKNGIKEGPWITWYKNGEIKDEGNYKNGNQHGLWKFWSQNGGLITKHLNVYIVGYDWCYPLCDDDVQSSYKFSSDGSFSFSTSSFDGMSRWGKWEEIQDETFKLTTTKISTNNINDQLPKPQILTLTNDKKKLKVGSTLYEKN